VKHLIWIPVALLAIAGVAALVLQGATGDAHGRELAFAAGLSIVSAELSLVPLALARNAGVVALFQAAFGGTVIHLFVTLAAGAGVYGLGLAGDRRTFLFLLLGFYWFSLVFVVIAMSKVFRRAVPADGAAGVGPAANAGHSR
jgi:hypothetical protein